jgi:hypothetical protein
MHDRLMVKMLPLLITSFPWTITAVLPGGMP